MWLGEQTFVIRSNFGFPVRTCNMIIITNRSMNRLTVLDLYIFFRYSSLMHKESCHTPNVGATLLTQLARLPIFFISLCARILIDCCLKFMPTDYLWLNDIPYFVKTHG